MMENFEGFKNLMRLLSVILWLLLLGYIVKAQDTSLVYFQSIGHTDSSYSNGSYKLVNLNSDTIIVDLVTRITYDPVWNSESNYDGDYINFDIIKWHVGIGEEQFNQYPIYFYWLNGKKTYVNGASLIPYRNYSYLKRKPNNINTRRQ